MSKPSSFTGSITKSATDIVFIASFLVVAVATCYLLKFGAPWSPLPSVQEKSVTQQSARIVDKADVSSALDERRASQAVWGQLGDYMGGVLNPILSFFALYLLMRTLQLQHVQIAQTEKALVAASAANEIAALAAALDVISEDVKQMQESAGYSDVERYERAVSLKTWLANEIANRAKSIAVNRKGGGEGN
jgi:hypothetical protein